MFRLGRCLLVGVQALLIFKGNKITPPRPSHPRRKKKKPKPQTPKTTKQNHTKKYDQTQQPCYSALYGNLCFDTKMNEQEAREEPFR